MKKIITLVLLCAFTIVFGACTKGCKTEPDKEVLNIGTNANFPPYETIDKNGKLVGFDIDVGNAIGEVLNRKVVWKEFDFDALILALNKGQIDIILSGLSITESRQKEIAMIPYQGEPLTDISLLFWQQIPSSVTSFFDLKQYSLDKHLAVSVQAGHFLEDFLRGQGIPVKALVGPPEQILDIKYKKSLAAAVDSTVGNKLAQEHEGIKNLILPLPKDKWDLGNGIGIKKSRAKLIEDIKGAVDKLKENGTLTKLKEQWFKGGRT